MLSCFSPRPFEKEAASTRHPLVESGDESSDPPLSRHHRHQGHQSSDPEQASHRRRPGFRHHAGVEHEEDDANADAHARDRTPHAVRPPAPGAPHALWRPGRRGALFAAVLVRARLGAVQLRWIGRCSRSLLARLGLPSGGVLWLLQPATARPSDIHQQPTIKPTIKPTMNNTRFYVTSTEA